MRKAGRDIAPVRVTGRKITTTFWGDAWCKNLESYSDYASRLPRGRTYVRNGSVLDLQIQAGRVRALVSGTELYTINIAITALKRKQWQDVQGRCAGQIDSLIELLQGAISHKVMEIVTRKGQGLFPSPEEITLDCSCPDWATMCKHVAAALYGVGVRLDHEPELLFVLRGVDPTELVAAAVDHPAQSGKPRRGRVLESDALSSVFGVDIDLGGALPVERSTATQPGASPRRPSKARTRTPSRAGKKKGNRKAAVANKAPAATKASRKPRAKTPSASRRAVSATGAKKKTRKQAKR